MRKGRFERRFGTKRHPLDRSMSLVEEGCYYWFLLEDSLAMREHRGLLFEVGRERANQVEIGSNSGSEVVAVVASSLLSVFQRWQLLGWVAEAQA